MTSKEALEFFVKNIDCDVYEFDLDKVIKHKRCLEQDLERLEKLEEENAKLKKVIEIMVDKKVSQFWIVMSESVDRYNAVMGKNYILTQEEYDLLKEYL